MAAMPFVHVAYVPSPIETIVMFVICLVFLGWVLYKAFNPR